MMKRKIKKRKIKKRRLKENDYRILKNNEKKL